MRVQLSEYAAQQLEAIWDYHAAEVGGNVADKIFEQIVADIDALKDHPNQGQVEPLLEHVGLEYRRVVSTHFKIIYRILDELIFVTDIFDSRQDPEKMVW